MGVSNPVEYYRGTVESYDDRAAYGYIRPDDAAVSEELLLVHRRSLRNTSGLLRSGDRVLFRTAEVPRGLLAVDVHPELDLAADPLELADTVSGMITETHYSRGYGFIEANGRRAFFHVSWLPTPEDLPAEGTHVLCHLVKGAKGWQAEDIQLASNERDSATETHLASPPRSGARVRDLLAQAVLARESRRYDEAAKLYERGLTECATVPLILSYAAMEKNLNRKLEAMRVYEKGIKKLPGVAKLHEDAGVLAASLGDFNKAISFLLSALDICQHTGQGGEKGVLLALARTYNRLETPSALQKSVEYYEQAARLARRGSTLPETDQLAANLARVRIQHYRGALACKFLRDAGFSILRAQLLEPVTLGADLVIRVDYPEFVESYGISGNMFVRCMFKASVGQSDLDDLDKTVREFGKTALVDEQVALLIVSSVPDNLLRTLFRRIEDRQRLVPAIIPLAQSAIEATGEPLASLRAAFDQWLYRRDLFAVNFPVFGRRFFGRDKPLAELRDSIATGTPTGVFGLRKVGKTSLLKEMERRSTESGDIVVYMDLLRVPPDVYDTRWLYWKLASDLHEKASMSSLGAFRWRLGGKFPTYLDVPSDFPVATAFDADLTQLLKNVKGCTLSPRPKVVLLLDEIERLLPNALGKQGFRGFFDFFGYIRGVSQESNDFVTVVTGANAAIAEAPQFEGRDNPVFNFFKEVYLQLLEPSECAAMIKSLGRGMGLRFPDATCDSVYQLTGGHPFFARQLCSFVASHYTDRPFQVSPSIISGVVDHYLESAGKDFEEILARLNRDYPDERDVCLALSVTDGTIPIERVAQRQQRSGVSLRHLEGYQIVRVEDRQVSLTMELFRRWLRGRFPDDR